MGSGRLIVSDPAIMAGQPVIAGTRITVNKILERLADGNTIDQILDALPGLSREGIQAALRFAAEKVRSASPVPQQKLLEIYGPHPVMVDEEPAIVVRAFAPEAKAVSVSHEKLSPDGHSPSSLFPMERIHPEGIFEAVFTGETEPFPYQLAVSLPGGETCLRDDPYRFSPALADSDLHLLTGTEPSADALYRLYSVLGAHLTEHEGVKGVRFAVWAPNAVGVSVIGDFNEWDSRRHPMRLRGDSGIWEVFVPGLNESALYKYEVHSGQGGRAAKADPFGFASELRPASASVVWDIGRYRWNDQAWMAARERCQRQDAPISIYEVHLGSWRRAACGEMREGRWLDYRELAESLIPYVKGLGYTHIELLPITEHPFDGSWGYQVTGFFAPTARHGTPDDFRYFVDTAHRAGLGVIMDWVPSHFPRDEHGLASFDGTPLFEHADPRRSDQHDWGTLAFDFERPEVCTFLLSNAFFWFDQYHIDGLRTDAVSSVLYLDYSRAPREWLPNKDGGPENLAAIEFFRRFNDLVHKEFPGVLTFAEESSTWPMVTGATSEGGLGFDFKWNMGWMHDTLVYFQKDPIYRRYHHNQLTFSLAYAFSERFALPFSHDEVVHGKSALLSKMPGDTWQKFANLRALYGYMYAHPGKKILFMGGELGQWNEWNFEKELDWMLLDRDDFHRQLQEYVKTLNHFYLSQPALHEMDFGWAGFQWIDCDDADRSLLSFIRRAVNPEDFIVVAANLTPVVHEGYRLGVPVKGRYVEVLNSDAAIYGGGNVLNSKGMTSENRRWQGQPHSVELTLPPLAVTFLKLACNHLENTPDENGE